MNKVFQTRFSAKDGNCFAACIATLLQITIEEAEPSSCHDEDTGTWWRRCNAFLKGYGYYLWEFPVSLSVGESVAHNSVPFYMPPSGGLLILSGKSPRGECQHAVIGQIETEQLNDNEAKFGLTFIHDPMPPMMQGGEARFIEDITTIGVLVPYRPSELLRARGLTE